MAITLTESAAKHVASRLDKRGKGVGLRLGVRTSGCSGLAYKIEYADDVRPEDFSFESHGVKVLVDPEEPASSSTVPELDFAREGAERGIQVQQSQRQGSRAAAASRFNVRAAQK